MTEKKIVLEELINLYKTSKDITYAELERVQKASFGKIYFTASTLKNKASKDGWNNLKGIELRGELEIIQDEMIQENKELIEVEKIDELERYDILEKTIIKKYYVAFNRNSKKLISLLNKENITDKDTREIKKTTKLQEEIIKNMDLEKKFLGLIDKEKYIKLQLEKVRLELLVNKRLGDVLS